ncbi:hypothetical protein IQ270_26495 [Microcoleus sp. LEGE 07076]|uniref:hypothetical protein n=1 Tax=Microcoleus sp. LEGE 07076 TaxID=915322 RepID=UPI001880E6AF|nr:hypothetical protein [Microcoleus sp. LEGE 07076]MBE9188091.1 hypothetical protein [Microcoleus sp. LEGE 07076]
MDERETAIKSRGGFTGFLVSIRDIGEKLPYRNYGQLNGHDITDEFTKVDRTTIKCDRPQTIRTG